MKFYYTYYLYLTLFTLKYMLWAELLPQNSCVEILTPRTSENDCI